MGFSYKEREKNLERLEREFFDLVVIGGGITGAGIARSASLRGMKVALIEASDFAYGTSSRSSKLIHGGIRYLEHLEFSLVFSALRERGFLFKMAPHLVHPLRFIIPVYKNSRVGYWKLKAGLWLYELLALFETPEIHESLSPDELRNRVPDIKSEGLVGAFEYSDAYTDDDRLVIETLRSAHREGTIITNYTRMTSAQRVKNGFIQWIWAFDELTGRNFKIRGKQYVSGVGPWTDQLGKIIDPEWRDRLRPTKGIHLVFSKETIPFEKAVVMAVEKRIIFVIPRREMVIVGTTDTDYRGDPEEVSVEPGDVGYLLDALNRYFPHLRISVDQILSTYSGVRPLVDDGGSSPGQTSRDYYFFTGGPNLNFVAGGKYTTYRKISEEVVDSILQRMDFETIAGFGDSKTFTPLNPKITVGLYQRVKSQVPHIAKEFQCHPDIVENLVYRHGEEALWIIKQTKLLLHSLLSKTGFSSGNLEKALPARGFLWMAEAFFAIHETMCLNLVDFYWRRSPLFLSFKDHGRQFIPWISRVFAHFYGWNEEELARQKSDLEREIEKELSWNRSSPR